MKTLTTLTAVAALIAGISLASAQTTTIGKDKNMSGSAMQHSARVIGSGKFCAKDKSGALNCQYASLSACQQKANGAACSANPNLGTTGAK